MRFSRATWVALLISSFTASAFADALNTRKGELQKLKETINAFQQQVAKTKSQHQKELDALKDVTAGNFDAPNVRFRFALSSSSRVRSINALREFP